jgi:DNA-binding protein WhiA
MQIRQKENSKLDGIITKIIINDANRQTNCDTANISKQISASERQIKLFKNLDTSKLSKKLQATIKMRIEHPDASYSELAELLGISKSGLVNRFRILLGSRDSK